MTTLVEAFKDLDEKKVYQLVEEMLSQGVPPVKIIEQCQQGLTQVGDLFAAGKYFLTELMFSAEIMKQVMAKLNLEHETAQNAGTVVIGTVKNDIHDIGKNIVVSLLRSSNFAVEDLGVDVPAEKFVEAVKNSGAKVVGLSALLNSTYPEMKTVVDAFKEAGIRDQVKVIIGGTISSEQVREFAGADYYAKDAVDGVRICKEIYGSK